MWSIWLTALAWVCWHPWHAWVLPLVGIVGGNPTLANPESATQRLETPGGLGQPIGPSVPVFNVRAAPFFAKGNGVANDTSSIQAAIDAQSVNGGTVFIPAGTYVVTNLRYYSGTVIIGAGFVGPRNAPGTLLYQTSAAAIILQPSTTASITSAFIFRDFEISAFGNAANLGGLDCTNCTDYDVHDIAINATAVFGVQIVGGNALGDSGFGHFTRVIVNAHQVGAYAWLISSSANDEPDGVTFTSCRISSSTGTWIHYANVGAKTGPGSHVWTGCTFECAGGTATTDLSFDATGSGIINFTDCRFENTGTGGIQFTLNGFGIQPAATFTNVTIAPGVGGLTWTDNGPYLSPRINCSIGSDNQLISQFTKSVQDRRVALVWGAAIAWNTADGNYFTIAATSNIAGTISGPNLTGLNAYAGITQEVTFEILNSTGGALTTPIAFAAGAFAFLSSGGVSPANGLTIEVKFRWNQPRQRFIEVSRGAAV